jgi:hypothetical protein
MSTLSTYGANKLLDLGFKATAWSSRPGTLHFAAFTTAPTDDGGGTEVSGGGYGRVAVTANGTNFTAAASPGNTVPNAVPIAFPIASADLGTVTAIGVFDQSSGGNLILWKDISPLAVPARRRLSFAAGDLVFSMPAPVGAYLSQQFLNHLLTGAAFPAISNHYYGLGTDSGASALTGEPTIGTNAYARAVFANNSSNYGAASGGSVTNLTTIQFPAATHATSVVTPAWAGVLDSFAIFDAATSGNVLWSASTGIALSVVNTDRPEWAAGDLTLSLT